MANKRKKKNKWRQYAGLAHLWLGLITGILVFTIAITGCIYVFHDEIKDIVYDWRHVEPENRNLANPSTILDTVKKYYPESEPNMVVYNGGERPATVFIVLDGMPHNIYLNPYSGEVTHKQNLDTDFFMVVERLHRFLLLPEKIGKHVTAIATFIFFIMLVTGLILWWPKKWKKVGSYFKIKWKARWRRKNYDWHRVTGLYTIFPTIIIAITGLSFSYEWMHDGLFYLGNVGNDETLETAVPYFEETDKNTNKGALDNALLRTQELVPKSEMYFVWNQGKGLPILTGTYPEALAFDHQSNFFFDPENGKLLASQIYADKSPGLKLQEMNYGLHTGQYFRLPGKILAFIVSLLVATLPITGFVIWYGRKKR